MYRMTSLPRISPTLLRKAREEQMQILSAPKVTLQDINAGRAAILAKFREFGSVYTVRNVIQKLKELHQLIKTYLGVTLARYARSHSKDANAFFEHMQALYIQLINDISSMNLRVKYTDPAWKELKAESDRITDLLHLVIDIEVAMDTSKDEELARRLSEMDIDGGKKKRKKPAKKVVKV